MEQNFLRTLLAMIVKKNGFDQHCLNEEKKWIFNDWKLEFKACVWLDEREMKKGNCILEC